MELDRTRLLSNDTTNPNGHRHLRATLGALASFVLLLLASSSASAATLNIVGGQLHGASGVDVGGTLYDVEFLDGTCIALYNGCDDVSDFTFQSLATATLASQALFDEVFLDGTNLFDSVPQLSNGCVSLTECIAVTVYGEDGVGSATVVFARNRRDGFEDVTQSTSLSIGFDFAGAGPAVVFAVWSPIPEPSTALLMGLGLAGLTGVRRR